MSLQHRTFRLFSVFLGLLLLSGCAETQLVSHYAKKLHLPGQEQSTGNYKVGKPYQVGSVSYYPQEDFDLTETGIASWYGPDFHGKRTANGEIYDQNELTAAHRTLQMPSFVRVTNLENGRSIVVRINDRGPFKRGRIIDVSKRAADLLGFRGQGTARVRLEVLEKESRQVANAAKRGVDTSRMTLGDMAKMEMNTPEPVYQEAAMKEVRVASNDNSLPESLRTPTITVEELSAPVTTPKYQTQTPSTWNETPSNEQPVAKKIGGYTDPLAGHLDRKGRFMPDPVVQKETVAPTGIFVQAGSFSVYENAERLSTKLSSIAPSKIEPVTVKGKQLYRVKLGPIASVDQADAVLDKVVRAGNDSARVIRD